MYDGKLYSNYQLKLIDFGSAVDLKADARSPWPTFQGSPIFSWTNASLEAVRLAKGALQSHTVNPSDDIFCLAIMVAGKSMTLVRDTDDPTIQTNKNSTFGFLVFLVRLFASLCVCRSRRRSATVKYDSWTVNRYYE